MKRSPKLSRTRDTPYEGPSRRYQSIAHAIPSSTVGSHRSLTPSQDELEDELDDDVQRDLGATLEGIGKKSDNPPVNMQEEVKIAKPKGEYGKPGRGGYSIQKEAGWDDSTYALIRVFSHLLFFYP